MRVIRYIGVMFVLFIILSCNKSEGDGRDTYCEFVEGKYTFDIDLRRTVFYKGIDFDYNFYDENLEEVVSDEAKFVNLKGIGKFYNESAFDAVDVLVTYSSLFKLPDINRIEHVNLNLLTTLEAERIIYLGNSGNSYENARKQVKDEIYDQVISSNYFNSYDFNKNVDYCELDLNNPFLAAYTNHLANMVSLAVQEDTENRAIVDVWNEYVLNYAMTGDLALSTLVPVETDSHSLINNNYGRDSQRLRASVSRFGLPFEGGIPQIRNNRIFYGVDTSSYKNKHIGLDTMHFRVYSHKYKRFRCNGYIDISADVYSDSLNYSENLEINVKQLRSNRKDTTYVFDRNELGSHFSTLLWLNKDADYQVSLVYGRDSLSYEVENRLKMDELNQPE